MKSADILAKIKSTDFDILFGELYGLNNVSNQKKRYAEAIEAFTQFFPNREEVHIYSVSGRTEIGGNHTDHQHGCVITGKTPDFYEVDVRDGDGLQKIFDEHKIDAVIHFAGLKAVGESVRKPLEYYRNNIEGTMTLCDVMRKNGCKNIIFHPNPKLHHIKKENIGLIEVMGLAVLPSRLADELEVLCEAMLSGADLNADPKTASHAEWAKEILESHLEFNSDNAQTIIRDEIGKVFAQVIEDAGVFKRNESGKAAFDRFVDVINYYA